MPDPTINTHFSLFHPILKTLLRVAMAMHLRRSPDAAFTEGLACNLNIRAKQTLHSGLTWRNCLGGFLLLLLGGSQEAPNLPAGDALSWEEGVEGGAQKGMTSLGQRRQSSRWLWKGCRGLENWGDVECQGPR